MMAFVMEFAGRRRGVAMLSKGIVMMGTGSPQISFK